MSEKRKSGFPPKHKDGEQKPRTIILKADREREPKKEVAKPKEEVVEKPPVILLKTREQTPKEEKQTPSASNKNESDQNVQTTKTSEAKEKKFSAIPLPPEMPNPVRLMESNLELNPAASEWLQEANTSFLVVGIVGYQGTGKSTIMNILAKERILDTIGKEFLEPDTLQKDSHDHMKVQNYPEVDGLKFIDNENYDEAKPVSTEKMRFKMQTLDQIEHGLYCTDGIDMYVTKDRVILLDSPPLCSASMLDDFISKATRSAGPVERTLHTESMQIASFLMSICHILIVVQDHYIDYNFVRFLLSCEMVRPAIEGASNCHLLLLHNHCRLEEYTIESIKNMQDFYRKAFSSSKLQLSSGMYLYPEVQGKGLNLDAIEINLNGETCGEPINLFLLPEIYEDEDNEDIYRGHPTFASLCDRLKWQILGAHRHQLSSLPNMTEKSWFQFCSKTWDAVEKCTFYMEYNRIMH